MGKQKNGEKPVTEAERLLKQYRSRLAAEGWIKSALCGVSVGFALNTIYAVICLVFGIKMFWVGVLLFLLGTATTPLMYFLRFRNTTRQVASRVDMLGLEERVLTMTQFESDDSFMARRQREDTVAALKKVNASLIKFAISVPLIVLCVTTFVLSATATTANALVDKSLIAIIDEAKEETPASYYAITYGVKDSQGGRVEGELTQTVQAGSATTPVQAIADDGYVFVGWTDGYEQAYRIDTEVDGNITAKAIFVPIDENDILEEEDDKAGEPDSSDKSGGGQENGQPQPSDPEDGDGEGNGGGAGGSSAPSNQVIDGQTFYGNEYGNSLSDAQDAMNAGTDLTGGQTGTIGDYFNNIAK
ncbi:MAG: hypothetical protein PUJ21_07785 [Clostridia bacterium]|nr:hypothetical protein [Clostridia bacterium]MDY6185109.1 hypothetical protein [Eubacteriales bacterium]